MIAEAFNCRVLQICVLNHGIRGKRGIRGKDHANI